MNKDFDNETLESEKKTTLSMKTERPKKKPATKYILSTETMIHKEKTLYRIRALRDFGNVKKDEFGGWAEKMDNLEQEGLCWIYDNAKVYDDALICNHAKVSGKAEVFDNAVVGGSSWVLGNAKICGSSKILGNNKIYRNTIGKPSKRKKDEEPQEAQEIKEQKLTKIRLKVASAIRELESAIRELEIE